MKKVFLTICVFMLLCPAGLCARAGSDSVATVNGFVPARIVVQDRAGIDRRFMQSRLTVPSIPTKGMSSLTTPVKAASLARNPYKFRGTQLIAPGVLLGVGATGLFVNPVKNLNREVSSNFTGNKRKGFDDYAQYVPFATPYLLKVCGVKSRHNYGEYTILLATSYLAMGIMVNGLKYTVSEMRPDGSARNSFPSGHTATAFMGAELLRAEFWETSPWIGIAGYALASTVGYMRIWHNRHWMTDVLAGAGIGILSVRIAYWTFPPLQRLFFGKSYRRNNSRVSAAPFYNYNRGSQMGASLAICF